MIWLERSRSAVPLIVRSSEGSKFDELVTFIFPHFHRIGECKLSVPDHSILFFESLLERSSNLFQVLDLSSVRSWSLEPKLEIRIQIPSLRRLRLFCVCPKWDTRSLTQLTHLILSNPMLMGGVEPNEVLEFLRSLDRLQSLEMDIPYCDFTLPNCAVTVPPVHLPRLHHLCLMECAISTCIHFATHLKYPSSANFELLCTKSNEVLNLPSHVNDFFSSIRNTPNQEYLLTFNWGHPIYITINELEEPFRKIRSLEISCFHSAIGREAAYLSEVFDQVFRSLDQLTHIVLFLEYTHIRDSRDWWDSMRRMEKVTSLKVVENSWSDSEEQPLTVGPLLQALSRAPLAQGDMRLMLLPALRTLTLDGFCRKAEKNIWDELKTMLQIRRLEGYNLDRLEVIICDGDGKGLGGEEALEGLVEALAFRNVICTHSTYQ